MTPRRVSRALYGSAGLFTVVGVGFLLLPAQRVAPLYQGPTVVRPTTMRTANETAAALLSFEEIVRTNLFSADRSPPTSRYTPPGRTTNDPVAPAPRASGPRLRLYGLANGPTGSVALIDADPSIPGAEIYRIDDRVGSYRLESIADSFVVLAGADGTSTTLRLYAPRGRSP